MAILAVVPAAGIGSRMQSSIPKQYLPVLGRPVLAHTLERLLALAEVRRVMVALAADDTWWPALRADVTEPRVQTCAGGADRWQSVLNALDALAQSGATDSDWVLVHDAVRPCVRAADIRRLVTDVAASGAVGGLLAVPVGDTLKRAAAADGVEEQKSTAARVLETVDREHLWAACTPQLFRLGALREALRGAAAAGIALTDEASAMEWSGQAPLLVPCARDNIKITWPDDLALAGLIIERGAPGRP